MEVEKAQKQFSIDNEWDDHAIAQQQTFRRLRSDHLYLLNKAFTCKGGSKTENLPFFYHREVQPPWKLSHNEEMHNKEDRDPDPDPDPNPILIPILIPQSHSQS